VLDLTQGLALLVVVLAMVPAMAHAFELPGKLRLSKEAYLAVQPIYYPGFTVLGFCEPLAIVLLVVVLILLPASEASFWWTLVALVSVLAMHAVYWFVTHPVNGFWLREEKLGSAASTFFSTASRNTGSEIGWKSLRDRWEYSHVARAALAALALVALVVAITADGRF
jgi:hypothetical protein